MSRPARFALPLLLAGSAAGCLGGPGNPRYFPYYLPPGDIIRTHAKPAGLGYFHNFDPKAARIEATPSQCNLPTGKQQVVIATVYDKDGQPRRKRRVEWMLDGPGYIVEVDESGYTPGRGYKVDNKYAVSYTDYFTHTFDRHNDDPRDDFTVQPGQTWCIVSSAVEGLTTVTAYAPEVADANCNTATVRLTWGAGGPIPPPIVSRSGQTDPTPARLTGADPKPAVELTLDATSPKGTGIGRETPVTLTVANAGTADSDAVTVSATVPDGAEYVSADPKPTARNGRDLTWTLGAVPGGAKRAVTLTVRPTRKGQFTVPVTARTADGQRATHQAAFAADTAGLKVAVSSPSAAAVGDPASVAVTVTNTGGIPAEHVTAWVGFDPGLEHESGKNPAEVEVGTVSPGEAKRVEVPLTPKQSGTFAVRVSVTADGDLRAAAEAAAVEARKPGLFVNVVGPDKLGVGQEATYTLTVTNPGDVPFDRVDVRAALPPGVRAKDAGAGKTDGPDAAVWRTGKLAPRDKQTLRLTVVADQPTARQNLSVKASGVPPAGKEVTAAVDAPVEVAGEPALLLEVAEVPGVLPVGQRTAVRVTVRNRGTAAAQNVEVAVGASEELTVTGGTGADRRPGQLDGTRVVFGVLDELPPGKAAVYEVTLEAAKSGSARVQAEVRADHLRQPLREEQAARVVGN